MCYELSKEIGRADWAWNYLEIQIARDAEKTGQPVERLAEIVDVDLAPDQGSLPLFDDRQAVRDAYECFLSDERLEDTPNKDFIRRRIGAQMLHLSVLEGAEADIFTHAETVTDSELRLIDETVLDDYQMRLEDQLGRHGLGFDPSYAEAFEGRLGLSRGKAAMNRFVTDFGRRSGMLGAEENLSDSPVLPEIVEKDKSWVGYAGINDETGRFYSQLNAHRRHSYTRGRAAAIVAHEGFGHIRDFSYKQQAIGQGTMDPLIGKICFVDPANVVLEMTAQGREQQVLRRVYGQDAWEYRFQADYHDYWEMVRNNALIYINTGRSQADVEAYMQSRLLPVEKPENITGWLQEVRDDPTMKANAAYYEPAMRIVRQVLRLPPKQQEAFFTTVSNYPFSEAQMQSLLDGES